jgi:hypothetical protein
MAALLVTLSANAAVVIPTNSVWRFFRGTNEASGPTGTEWRTNTFDDSSWETGQAPFYFGTNYNPAAGTLLSDIYSNYNCIMLRSTFYLSNVAQVIGISNRPYVDDGFLLWINGVELRRFDLFGTAGTFLPYYTNANIAAFSAGWTALNSFTNILRQGTNVMAMQVFNKSWTNDADFFANPELAVALVPGPPTVIQATPSFGATVSELPQVTVVFNRNVTGVAVEDFLVNGQPATGLSGSGTTYTFTFPPPASTNVSITWDGNHIILDDTGVRMNETNNTWGYTIVDMAAPVVSVLTPAAGSTVGSLAQVSVLFHEAVNGVDAADLLVNGTPAVSAFGAGAGPYLFQFPQPATGTVQLAWSAGHNIRDNAVSPNAFGGGSWTVTLNPALFTGDVIINEVTAANVVTNGGAGTLDLDEFNQAEDWIELFNRGSNSVRLLGWSLTDNPNDPGLWTFPDITLTPGQYLVVYASERNRKTLGGTNRLHTSFALNPNGEYLALFNAESPRRVMSEFNPQFPEQRNDYSYGLIGSNTWRYFNPPTPGAANGSSTITNIVPVPHVNVARGYFNAPFTLVASCDVADATLRYTTDGTEPLGSSAIFPGTLTVSNTTVLRIAGFRTGMLPSRVSTHSYIFLDQVIVQPNNPAGFPSNWGPNASFPGGVVPADYEMDMDPMRVDPNNPGSAVDPVKLQRLKDGLRELPVMSIVMKTDDIFGTAGLYQRSAVETGVPGNKPENKKPCSVEMFLPDGTTAFATTCGIDLHGNASRNPVKNPKHGFKLKFRGDFGPPSLEYKLFEDSPVEDYDDILLRPDFNSSWRHWSDTAGQGLGAFQRTRAVRTRDAWMKDAMRDMGGLASHSRFVHLFLNGLYWGTFDLSEDPTESFAKNALGGSGDDYDVVDQGVLKNGTLNFYNAMIALPAPTTIAQYDAYRQYLNMPEFIDYMLLHFYMGHQDWSTTVTKNWAAIRKRVPGPEGTFKYLPWDGECILLEENVNRVTVTTPPSGLHTKLDDSLQYRLDFADRIHKHMVAPDGMLRPAANIARWQKWQAIMDKPIVAESARWGDYRRDVHQSSEGVYQLYTREGFVVPENNRMVNSYFANRTTTVLGQLRAVNMYPSVSAPVYNQQGGRVSAGFALTMSATNTIYYTTNDTDPRIYGTGAISPLARAYTGAISLNESAVVKARALFGTNWSALNEASFVVGSLIVPLAVTEIMYNPVGGDAYEFIELQNIGPLPLNLGDYSFNGISFNFPFGYVLNAGQRIVLGNNANTNAFNGRYPGVAVAGWFGNSLANGGETISILDNNGRVILSVTYNDENGWPTAPDGGGYSLELSSASGDPDDPANWRASNALNGTPGQANSPPPAATVVINEVMAENLSAVNHQGTFPDWVELFNAGAGTVNLTGWSLSDDGAEPRRFVFPSGTTMAAGAYLVVWCDSTTNTTSGLHSGFALHGDGELVSLYDPNTNRIDAVSFGPQAADYSIGRVASAGAPGAWALTSPTTNAVNVAAALAPASSLSINEWLANTVPGGDDWIELFNTSSALPVALRNVYLGTSNALFQIRSLSFVGPRAFVQLIADGDAGSDHLDFTLLGDGDAIVLYDATGAEVQRVIYGAQAQGVSQGRLPDGTASIVPFPGSASPGGTNYLLNYTGPVLNEVLARNSAAAISPWGSYADFIEIYSPSSANLSGMGLSDDPDEVKFTFPQGTFMAGGRFVVWCDGGRAASTSASASMNAGFSLSGRSGGVYLFNTNGQAVNSVEYGLQVQDRPIGRSPDGWGSWRLLSSATPGAGNSAPTLLAPPASLLSINEWMAAASSSGDDWIELYNHGNDPVELSGLILTDDPSLAGLTATPIAPLSFIAGKGFVQLFADGNLSAGRDHLNFALDAQGEMIRLYDTNLAIIDSVSFGAQTPDVSQGRLPDRGANIVSFPTTPTPEKSNYLPLPNVVISEVLTHTDPPFEDAIEVQNIGTNAVTISDWWLSTSEADFYQFPVGPGTTLAPGEFKVFYQVPFPFTLNSARGDTVYLSESVPGGLTGYRAQVTFGAAENGVSFGRFNTSVGSDFTAMSQRTFGVDNPADVSQFRAGTGLSNSYPKIGPVIISEIMYHPVLGSGSNVVEIANEEFIELHNITDSPVPMFDSARPTNVWRLDGGVSFAFTANHTIPARGYLLLVNFNPTTNVAAVTAFRAKYGNNGSLAGPFQGRLDNAGEELALFRPDAPQQSPDPDAGFVPMILVDRVVYGDAAPWPLAPDGGGASLQRLSDGLYGNEPLNWKAEPATAGTTNTQSGLIAPTISGQPTNTTVVLNATATLTVVANGSGPLNYQWQHANTNLPGANSATLVIASARLADAGVYRVVVTNGAGSITSQDATLTVLAPPDISVPPQTQTAVAGTTAQFSVTASGTAPLRYQWRFNNGDLIGQNDAVLVLNNVQPANAGNYTVVITNTAGSVTSAPAVLVVNVPPTITSDPTNVTVLDGESATFMVSATGTAPLHYQWRKDGLDIPGANGTSYTISAAQAADAGLYSVMVTNIAGSATSLSALLSISSQPFLASPRVRADRAFEFMLVGPMNRTYTVEFSTNLTGWNNLTNFVLGSPQVPVTDTGASNAPSRFYRVIMNP